MKAIEFAKKLSESIEKFFNDCCKEDKFKKDDVERVEIKTTDYGFTLRLETDESINGFVQEFGVWEDEIVPLYLEVY